MASLQRGDKEIHTSRSPEAYGESNGAHKEHGEETTREVTYSRIDTTETIRDEKSFLQNKVK